MCIFPWGKSYAKPTRVCSLLIYDEMKMLWPQRNVNVLTPSPPQRHPTCILECRKAEKMVQKQLIYYETQPTCYVHCVHMLPFNHKCQPSAQYSPGMEAEKIAPKQKINNFALYVEPGRTVRLFAGEDCSQLGEMILIFSFSRHLVSDIYSASQVLSITIMILRRWFAFIIIIIT